MVKFKLPFVEKNDVIHSFPLAFIRHSCSVSIGPDVGAPSNYVNKKRSCKILCKCSRP